MTKKIIFLFLAMAFVLSSSFLGLPTQAYSDYSGEIVKMDGLNSLYYVTSDGKRYVFPNGNIYKSWFTDFDEVSTIPADELQSIPLGGNVLYRPGVMLVKITTDPKVYAVGEGGMLRWITTEEIAKALYGNNWNLLVDDVPDSFFTNYYVGSDIDDASDFDPDNIAENIDTIDANHGLSSGDGLRAQTQKCQVIGYARNCLGEDDDNSDDDDNNDSDDNNNNSDDDNAPYITEINISNNGSSGYIDVNDKITVTFNEAIDPTSINSKLTAGGQFTSLDYDITGSINVSDKGVVTIEDIASFDIGSTEDSGKFIVKLDLNSNADVLTITIVGGDDVEINDEDFDDAEQIAGTIKDKNGNTMESDSDIGEPEGSFGGKNINDGIEPLISSIEVSNGGSGDYIAVNDKIEITFSEEIDPESINDDLDEGGSVSDIDHNETGGVSIDDDGILLVTDIASFSVGDVDDDGEFEVKLSLDSKGEVLTITLTDGDEIEVINEDLDDAEQIGDVIEDKDGNEMEDDPRITDPTGTFIGDSAGGNPYISHIKAYDYGYAGFIDVDDKIVITFNEEINPETIHRDLEAGDSVEDVDSDDIGGVEIDNSGMLTVADIVSFDVGRVEEGDDFDVELTLSSSGKALTITLVDGDPVEIEAEDFNNTEQIGGTIEDKNGNLMEFKSYINNPSGTFGGDGTGTTPYITEIEIDNGDRSEYIDEGDVITITFSEAIDPESIDNDLELDESVNNVDDDDTGGVTVEDDGLLTVTDITQFYVGNVDDDGEFEVEIAINDLGNIVTITLTDGDDIGINYEDLDDAEQIGGTIEDEDGNEMEDDPNISDPEGSF